MVLPEDQAEALAQAVEEGGKREANRVGNWIESFVLNPVDPPMALTPKEIVLRRGKARLYRYTPQTRLLPVPLVILPWMGISRPTILDMLPGNSLIEFLVSQGFDTYLLDWGEMAEEDRHLGWESAIGKLIPSVISRVLELSGAEQLSLAGLCLGGTMAMSYTALTQDPRVRNLLTIVAPVDFSKGGLFEAWLGQPGFPIDLLVQQHGGVPAHLMGVSFKMLRPTLDVHALSGLWYNMDRKAYVTTFKAMSKWANEYVAMPGAFAAKLVKDLYSTNKLIKGEFEIQGQFVDLKRIRQPLLVIAASQDYIAPAASCKPLMELVSSREREYIELPGGHISVFSGRHAKATLWPQLQAWLAPRSGARASLQALKGVV